MKTKLFAAATLSVIAVIALATNAFAHSRPIRFDPAPGAVLSTAPAKVEAWFTSDMRRDPNWTYIRVTDAQGTRVDSGETTLSTDRRQLSVALKSGLGSGRYVVTWRNWDDSDGEIFGDCYTFFVGQAAADAAVNDKFRLDAGSSCERLELGTEKGTPTPDQVKAAGVETDTGAAGDSGGSGIPAWALVLGVVGGVVAGSVGARFIGSKS
jgi:methionine-rich copper-binding protein CopC